MLVGVAARTLVSFADVDLLRLPLPWFDALTCARALLSAFCLCLTISSNNYFADAFVFVGVEINPIQTVSHFFAPKIVISAAPYLARDALSTMFVN